MDEGQPPKKAKICEEHFPIINQVLPPEMLKKIRDESDDGSFSFLAKCVKETLRMYAPVPIMVTRYVQTGNKKMPRILKEHDKITLEDGDRILIPTIILQNNPKLWIDPNTYNPDRFDAPEKLSIVGDSAKMLRGKSGIQPRPKQQPGSVTSKCRYFPFGKGKHFCLGQPYATWLTLTITSTICSNFDMEIEDTEKLLDKECSYERIKDHVYTFPKAPFKAQITRLDNSDERNTLRKSVIRSQKFVQSMIVKMDAISEFIQDDGIDDTEL